LRGLTYTYTTAKCIVCGREFVVERILIGVDHTVDLHVTCKECVLKSPFWDEFKEQHPEEAKAIEAWVKDEINAETLRRGRR